MSYVKRILKANSLAIIFFVILFVIGISVYKDYGVSWDEPTQRDIGKANLHYILGYTQRLLEMNDRFYGPTYEIFLLVIEKITKPVTLRETYLVRHLFTFLTFFVGVISFYLLSKNIYKKSSTALLSSIALVLSPRIFDNAFYNTKDIPLLVFFIICFTLLFYYLDTKKIALLIALAIFSALTITIRIAGIIVPCLTILVIAYNYFRSPLNRKQKMIWIVSNLALFLFLVTLFTVLLWPILWTDPIGNFLQSIQKMSHFAWNSTVLFMGTTYGGDEIPSIYPIVWILISTPIFYSILFFIGTAYLFISNIKNLGRNLFRKDQLKLLFIAGWFFAPLILVIIMKSVLYDSWRHLFFIYPAFVLLAFWGFEKSILYLNEKFGRIVWLSAAIYGTLIIVFGLTTRFMIQAHPYEQLYFNRLAGSSLSEIQKNYDTEYWGLSYRSGLEYISRNDPDPVIPYMAETAPAFYTFILPPEDQKRLVPAKDEREAKYLITNYRFDKTVPNYPEVYSVQVDGAKIMSVFKLK